MTGSRPSQDLYALEGEIGQNGFSNLELYVVNHTKDRVRFECYASDGWDNYSVGEYLGDIQIIVNKDEKPIGALKEKVKGLIGRPTK